MSLEKNIADYLKARAINLAALARTAGLDYGPLYNCLYQDGREIKGNELLSICRVIDKDPMDFADKAN